MRKLCLARMGRPLTGNPHHHPRLRLRHPPQPQRSPRSPCSRLIARAQNRPPHPEQGRHQCPSQPSLLPKTNSAPLLLRKHQPPPASEPVKRHQRRPHLLISDPAGLPLPQIHHLTAALQPQRTPEHLLRLLHPTINAHPRPQDDPSPQPFPTVSQTPRSHLRLSKTIRMCFLSLVQS